MVIGEDGLPPPVHLCIHFAFDWERSVHQRARVPEDGVQTFFEQIIEDMKHGRESWRVIVATALPALVITLAVQLLR